MSSAKRTGIFNFEVAPLNCYAAAMSRKTPSNSTHGFGDIIGVALLAAALLLLVAQWSFDRNDISFLTTQLNKPTHNWIGPLGAYLAWASFIPFGLVAYLLPVLLAVFGLAYLLNFPSHLRERLQWSLIWSATLVLSLTGLLYILDNAGWLGKIHETIGSLSAGGWLGFLTFGQTPRYEYGFCLLGTAGAIIVYAALCLISLLFLTNFRLGEWIRGLVEKVPAGDGAEPEPAGDGALERRARELEKQAQKLQEEVARTGLGADMQPVPEPTVRDLSVPQAKPDATSARIRKTTLPGGVIKNPPAAKKPRRRGRTKPRPVKRKPFSRVKFPPPPPRTFSVKNRPRKNPRKQKSRNRKKLSRKSPPNRRFTLRTVPCRRNPRRDPKGRNPSPSPRRPSSAITSCRRWIFCSTPT